MKLTLEEQREIIRNIAIMDKHADHIEAYIMAENRIKEICVKSSMKATIKSSPELVALADSLMEEARIHNIRMEA